MFKVKLIFSVFVLSACCFTTSSIAKTVLFDFHISSSAMGDAGLAFDDAESSVSYLDPISGLSITAEAFLDGVSGGTDLNGTGNNGYFGVNAAGSGDDTDQLDGANGTESIVFSFSEDVTLLSMDFNAFGGSGGSGEDRVSISISSGFSTTMDGNDFTNDLFETSQLISTADTLTIAWVDGGGVGLQSLSVDFTPAIVPEPSTYAAIFGLLAFGLTVSYRRRHKS